MSVSTTDLAEKIKGLDWYSCIDFGNGLVTPGMRHYNEKVINALLDPLALENRHCLEIGAADGNQTMRLSAMKARTVAHDYYPRETFQLVSEFFNLNVNTRYITGDRIEDMPAKMKSLGLSPFDFVLFGGVLYHTLDPLRALLAVRHVCRPGTLVLIESACCNRPDFGMHFNAEGVFFGNAYSYWFPTPNCLKYCLMLCGMMPLKEAQTDSEHSYPVVRHAVLARAMTTQEIGLQMPWLSKLLHHKAVPELFPDLVHPSYADTGFTPIPCEATITGEDLRRMVEEYKARLRSERYAEQRAASPWGKRVLRGVARTLGLVKP